MELCSQEKCTGCMACMNSCPKEAIGVKNDITGKTVPDIDKNRCIECGLCRRSCPELNIVKKESIKRCYAAWTKNQNDKEVCSSGGISTGLARCIIRDGGVVFGSAFKGNLTLENQMESDENRIHRFSGSKYVQSFVGYTYREAKHELEQGRMVLYVGTPCQIAGLKAYLKKDYDNLLTVDIVCHGTPPIAYLKEYKQYLLKNKKVTDCSFRGRNDFSLCFYQDDKCVYKKYRYKDYYFYAFLEGLIHRDNCYQCQYAEEKRVSDLTIGDFWGLNRKNMVEKYDGRISEILVNSQKGNRYLERYADAFILEERDISEAVNGNGQLRKPSEKNSEYDLFINNYKKLGFVDAIKKTKICGTVKRNNSVTYRLFKNIGLRR